MKLKTTAVALFATLTTAGLAAASEVPAWQEPGFVMEEVVATAPRVKESPTLAWQEPGYVMEEVVATASRSEAIRTVAANRSEARSRRARSLAARALILHMTSDLVRRAGKLDVHFDVFSSTP